MPYLTDVKFTKVLKKGSGENRYGPWQLYLCHIDAPEWKGIKLAYFKKENKPTPLQGMALQVLEYDTRKKIEDGKTYTDYIIKDFVPAEQESQATPVSVETSQQGDSQKPDKNSEEKASYYVSYAKDILIALIAAEKDTNGLPELCDLVVEAGLKMRNNIITSEANMPTKKADTFTDTNASNISVPDDPFGDDFPPPESYEGN